LFWRIELKDALKHGDAAVVSYSFCFWCTGKTQALLFFVTEFNFAQFVD
jgi:hypothetical protein